MMNKNITAEKIPHPCFIPFALTAWPVEGGEDEEIGNKTADNHACPKILTTPEKLSPFNNCLYLPNQVPEDTVVWFADGSCFYDKGKPHTGFEVINPKTGQKIWGSCEPHSAQAAEVVAIAVALEHAEKNHKMWLYFQIQIGSLGHC